MKYLIGIIVLVSVITTNGCCRHKTVVDSVEEVVDVSIENEEMLELGFQKGVIVVSDIEGDCPVTIRILDSELGYLLDPINLEEKYELEGTSIWVKYSQLRMKNRCEKANPITIDEIKFRQQ